jgi:hypothetical protein
MRQQLESMMDSYHPTVSEQRQTTYFVVGDLESLSASALYTPKIKVGGNKIIIPYAEGLHDAFRYDRYGNLDEGHTTVNLPNGGKLE